MVIEKASSSLLFNRTKQCYTYVAFTIKSHHYTTGAINWQVAHSSVYMYSHMHSLRLSATLTDLSMSFFWDRSSCASTSNESRWSRSCRPSSLVRRSSSRKWSIYSYTHEERVRKRERKRVCVCERDGGRESEDNRTTLTHAIHPVRMSIASHCDNYVGTYVRTYVQTHEIKIHVCFAKHRPRATSSQCSSAQAHPPTNPPSCPSVEWPVPHSPLWASRGSSVPSIAAPCGV